MADKQCESCGVSFPTTEEYWHRDRQQPDGYRKTCKMCRAEDKKEKENELIDARIAAIEKEGFNLLANLTKGGSDIPHMAETFQKLIEVFGGPGGFAQHFMASFLSTSLGSATRQKMLDTVLRLNIKVSESGAAQKSLEEITDEDLDREIEETAKRLILLAPKRLSNAKEKEKAPAGRDSDS